MSTQDWLFLEKMEGVMKELQLLVYLSIVSFLLSACSVATPGNTSSGVELSESYIFEFGYEMAWKATIDTLKEEHLFRTSDYNEALVITEYSPLDKKEPEVAQTDIDTNSYTYSYAVRLYPRGDAHTEINIAVELLHMYGQVFQQRENLQDLESSLREKLLTRICNNLQHSGDGKCDNFTPASGWELPPEVISAHDKKTVTLSGDKQIVNVQRVLEQRGYDPGAIDGIMGNKTIKAIRSLQSDHNIAITGMADNETLRVLGLQFDMNQGASLVTEKVPDDEGAKGKNTSEHSGTDSPIKPIPGIVTKATYLMNGASVMAESLIEVPQGTVLQLFDKKGCFFKTKYRGRQGYIYERSIQTHDDLTSLD